MKTRLHYSHEHHRWLTDFLKTSNDCLVGGIYRPLDGEYVSVYPTVEEDTSPDAPNGTCSNSTKSVICIQLYKEATSHYLTIAMLPIPPRPLQLMALMVQQQQEDAAALVALLYQRRRRRRPRHYWVRPGLLEDLRLAIITIKWQSWRGSIMVTLQTI